ncbi:MAG: hypothetical protein RLZZ450_2535 [Pseudomonadota bacterium]
MKILIIPEDQTSDGFIAKPIVEALCADAQVPARVDVLPEPRLRGAAQALNPDIVREIIADNPMTDLFILVIDRDCDRDGHVAKATAREGEHAGKLVACVAEQELEVWLLALHRKQLGSLSWKDVRAHCDPKEEWAEPLLRQLGAAGPGGGRKGAMRALRGSLKTLVALCPELQTLQTKIIQHCSREN